MDFFRKLDVNKDGRVSASEFRSILPLFGPDPTFTEDDLDVLFQSIDDDGSGSIGYQELNAVLRQGLQTKLDEDLKAGAVEFEMESKLLRHDLRTSSNKRLIIHGGGVGSGGESADGGNGPSFSTGPSAKPTVLLLVECSPNAESASCRHSLDKYAAYFGLLKAAFDGKVIPSNDTEDTERSMTVKVQQTPETLAPVWSDEAEWWPGGKLCRCRQPQSVVRVAAAAQQPPAAGSARMEPRAVVWRAATRQRVVCGRSAGARRRV